MKTKDFPSVKAAKKVAIKQLEYYCRMMGLVNNRSNQATARIARFIRL